MTLDNYSLGNVTIDGATLAGQLRVGGKMVGAYNIEDEEYETVSLDASNYFKYIYGSGETTDWGDSTDYDGATFLEAKPSTITPAEY